MENGKILNLDQKSIHFSAQKTIIRSKMEIVICQKWKYFIKNQNCQTLKF